MKLSSDTRQCALFVRMCVTWGTNWLALKAGAMAVPPAFFSGTRWTAAGLILLAFGWSRGQRLWIGRRLARRMLAVAFLMVGFNAVVLLYGLRFVGSGLAAVISSSLTPVSLLGFSVLMGQERFSRRQAGATALGVVGILMLFGPKAFTGRLEAMELLGIAGVLASTLAYSAGSVLARPLLRSLAPVQMAASTNFLGGLMLLAFSFAFEPGAWTAASGHWGWPAWAGWLFLLDPRFARRHHDLFPAGARLGRQPDRHLLVHQPGDRGGAGDGGLWRAGQPDRCARHRADAAGGGAGVAALTGRAEARARARRSGTPRGADGCARLAGGPASARQGG